MNGPTISRLPSNLTLPIMERVSFPLEKIHIIRGQKCSPNFCPVALAMVDAGLNDPSVLPSTVYYSDADGQRWKALPSKGCTDWIRRYDCGGSMEPTVIELESLVEGY